MSALGLLIDPDCVLCKDHDFPLEPLSRHVALDVSVADLSHICIHVSVYVYTYIKTQLTGPNVVLYTLWPTSLPSLHLWKGLQAGIVLQAETLM